MCQFKHKVLRKDTIYNFSTNCILIISLNQIRNNQYKVHDLIEFDENNITIPGDIKKTKFILNAAIRFIPFNKYAVNRGGHYTCWRRSKLGGWIEISDTVSTRKDDASFRENIKYFYLLFLQKKIYC